MKKKLFYGRVKSRKLSDIKIKFIKRYLRDYKLQEKIFNTKKKIVIEIGFGIAENIIDIATKNKRNILIGIDPFKNGLSNIARKVYENKINNIFVYPFVFEKFTNKFKKFFFNELYILFPDPWPKKKHNKRRLFNEKFLKSILIKGKMGSKIYFRTDNIDYFFQVKNLLRNEKKNYKLKIMDKFDKKIIKTKYHKRAESLKHKVRSLLIIKK